MALLGRGTGELEQVRPLQLMDALAVAWHVPPEQVKPLLHVLPLQQGWPVAPQETQPLPLTHTRPAAQFAVALYSRQGSASKFPQVRVDVGLGHEICPFVVHSFVQLEQMPLMQFKPD